MPITSISRDWGVSPAIVRMSSTDTLAQVSAADYLITEETTISQLNNGEFEWVASDMVAVYAADGFGMFYISSDFSTLTPQAGGLYHELSFTLAQFLDMYTTPIKLLDAPGANRVIILKQFQLILNYGSAPFAAGGVTGVQYDSIQFGAGFSASTTHPSSDFYNNESIFCPFNQISNILSQDSGENLGLYLSNQTAAFTGGTGATFSGRLWYDILNLV